MSFDGIILEDKAMSSLIRLFPLSQKKKNFFLIFLPIPPKNKMPEYTPSNATNYCVTFFACPDWSKNREQLYVGGVHAACASHWSWHTCSLPASTTFINIYRAIGKLYFQLNMFYDIYKIDLALWFLEYLAVWSIFGPDVFFNLA